MTFTFFSFNNITWTQPSNEFVVESLNAKLSFLAAKEGKDDAIERDLKKKLLSRLEKALDEFIANNKREVKELQQMQMKQNVIRIWQMVKSMIQKIIEKIGEVMVNLWEVFDGTMEALDSIPDILQEFALRFKQWVGK